MNKRLLIILGTVVLLGMGGCVGTGYYTGAYGRSYGYAPWLDGGYPYTGSSPYYSHPYPGFLYYPEHHHDPVIIDGRHRDWDDRRIVKDRDDAGRHLFDRGGRRDGDHAGRPERHEMFSRPQHGVRCGGARC